ncbi:MAG: hydrogenase expression/formation protein HypE [Pseudomonadota bacterium]
MTTPQELRLGHGGGGQLARDFIQHELLPRLDNPVLRALGDGAVLEFAGRRLAFTTDSFVVQPRFFEGGCIGSLAVNGTVNDLACCGARPRHLSLALIAEEGLSLDELRRILDAVSLAARAAGVEVVCGDTKVVPRGQVDGLFINTAGIGEVAPGLDLGLHRVVEGDRLLVSGPIGDHGAAILVARGQLGQARGVESDCAPVHELCAALVDLGPALHFLRDPTRGGLGGVTTEIADGARCAVHLDLRQIPVRPSTRAVCELAGLDPLLLPCEGRVLAVVAADQANEALTRWHGLDDGRQAAVVGSVAGGPAGQVVLATEAGTQRLFVLPMEDPLPRIC